MSATALLLGADGQVGRRLSQLLGGECVALTRAQCDIGALDDASAAALIATHQPAWLINAAAFTAVDAAEEQRAQAHTVNAVAPGILAHAAAAAGVKFLHLSTDYVFDGKIGAPYSEAAKTNPLNHYGHTKWLGEEAIRAAGGHAIIARLQWVYDKRGSNFYLTMKKLLAERAQLRVVADQFGAPSNAPDIARALQQIISNATIPAGTYHLANQGVTSWHGFTCAIASQVKDCKTTVLEPITAQEYGSKTIRPRDTRLDCGLLASHGVTMPHWHDGLMRLMEEPCT